MSSTTVIESSSTLDNTIVVDDVPPGHNDYPSDDEIEDLPVPAFEDITMTNTEKQDALKKWSIHRQKHEKKKRQKNAFIY